MITKQELRTIFKEKRHALFKQGEIDKISSKICEKLSGLINYYKAGHILAFYPKGSELDVRRLLDKNACDISSDCYIEPLEQYTKISQNINTQKPNIYGNKPASPANNRHFYLPFCKGDKILACPYKSGDELSLNKFKIYEPTTKPVLDIEILDMIITPALCADFKFNRLGYGGGFYDRFFANHNLRAKKVVIVPDDMLIEAIPTDKYDKKCDIIVTEKRTLEAKDL